MLVYVVCEYVDYDSYHQIRLVTLDKAEAEKSMNDFNAIHDPECRTQRKTWSDWDECFCKRRHMHELPLGGLTVLSEMSDLTSAAECARVEDVSTDAKEEH